MAGCEMSTGIQPSAATAPAVLVASTPYTCATICDVNTPVAPVPLLPTSSAENPLTGTTTPTTPVVEFPVSSCTNVVLGTIVPTAPVAVFFVSVGEGAEITVPTAPVASTPVAALENSDAAVPTAPVASAPTSDSATVVVPSTAVANRFQAMRSSAFVLSGFGIVNVKVLVVMLWAPNVWTLTASFDVLVSL